MCRRTAVFSVILGLFTIISMPTGANAAPSLSCKPPCEAWVDYQNPKTALSFSRTRQSNTLDPALPDSSDQTTDWRHRYDIVLTQNKENRVLFDEQGNRHIFKPTGNGKFTAESTSSGTLLSSGNQHIWINNQGVRHTFHGSYLTNMEFDADSQLVLRYKDRQLHTVTDDKGQSLQFFYNDSQLAQVVSPDGQIHSYPPPHCMGQLEQPQTCDTENSPPSASFLNTTQPGATFLDARPESCASYFTDFYGTVRGSEIETGFGTLSPYNAMIPTVQNYPQIDFINGTELIVVRSRDLASPSFNNPENPDALLDRLVRDGKLIQTRFLDPLIEKGSISSTKLGETTTIHANPEQQVSFHLVIRHQLANPAHWAQIEQAKAQLQSRFGMELKVIVIP